MNTLALKHHLFRSLSSTARGIVQWEDATWLQMNLSILWKNYKDTELELLSHYLYRRETVQKEILIWTFIPQFKVHTGF